MCSEAAIALCFGTLASGTPINLQRQIEFADGWLAVQVWGRVVTGQLGGRKEGDGDFG